MGMSVVFMYALQALYVSVEALETVVIGVMIT